MSYVIVDVTSTSALTRLYRKGLSIYGPTTFETLRGARMVATKRNKELGEERMLAMSYADYEAGFKIEPKMVVKKNLMSGKEILVAEGTPLCCDPSSETFWSM